jgi:hypothetical protein
MAAGQISIQICSGLLEKFRREVSDVSRTLFGEMQRLQEELFPEKMFKSSLLMPHPFQCHSFDSAHSSLGQMPLKSLEGPKGISIDRGSRKSKSRF